ncbi:MAG TPA: DUF1150 family protein [Stellaceae bacterium]|jgi:hypothetical protein|nr:DUF1150 family protein [Stellaceae bacterium]
MNAMEKLRQISPREFVMLGMQDIAYIKRMTINDGIAFAIHAADGTQVAILNDRETAFATVRQHELEPVSVH